MASSPLPVIASSEACRRVAFPFERRLVLDTLHLGHHKPMMHGLLEVDGAPVARFVRDRRARLEAAEGLPDDRQQPLSPGP